MDQVQEIRDKTDVVTLLSEYIKVKQAGRNFKALCPFHSEKSPSFVISPERQIWHCFGCQKGGDVFTFLMEYEHLEFGEALRVLAKRAGVALKSFTGDTTATSQKERLYTLNRLAGEFYHYILLHHPAGKKALTYLTDQRQITPQLIKTFHIGFAPHVGNALVQYLTKKKQYQLVDIVEAGLANMKGRDGTDFFRGRIIFPLFDHLDNIVGFSGRVIEGQDTFGPKYINTRETSIYHKGQGFFGLQVAKDGIKKEQSVLIMEGEFDVISAYKEGFCNSVAIKGTALTDDQVRLLSRFTQKFILCLDQDSAGQEAMKRSIGPIERRKLIAQVAQFSEGKDPDELLKTNPLLFKKAVKEAVGLYDFLFEKTLLVHNKTTVEGKKKIGDELLPLLSAIENEIVKEHYLRKLSSELATSYESLVRQAEKLVRTGGIRLVEKEQEKDKQNRRELLEEYLLALLIQEPIDSTLFVHIATILEVYRFLVEARQKIFERLGVFAKTNAIIDAKIVAHAFPEELQSFFNTAFLLPLPEMNAEGMREKEIEKTAKELLKLHLKTQIKVTTTAMKELEQTDNQEHIEKLQQQLTVYITLLRSYGG